MLPDATHHPYSVPSGYEPTFTDNDDTRINNFHSSLHYTDWVFGRLQRRLEALGMLEDTVFVVMGDHGEAFGDFHEKNYLHKNFLYEENVRSFMIYGGIEKKLLPEDRTGFKGTGSKPAPVQRAVHTSGRLAEHGDLLPTVLDLLGEGITIGAESPVRGQSLFRRSYTPRSYYFHKIAEPPQYGVRDGRWKYIADRIGPGAEMFDLQADPHEQHDLLAGSPSKKMQQQADEYRRLCDVWFNSIHCDFVDNLAEYGAKCPAGARPPPPPRSGAIDLKFGYIHGEARDMEYLDKLPTNLRQIALETSWVPYDWSVSVVFDWAPKEMHPIGLIGQDDDQPFNTKRDVSLRWRKHRYRWRWHIDAAWHTAWY